MSYINRRRFLKSSSALGFSAGTGLLAALGGSNAFSAEVNGYKALVCVFLKGGMDSMDFILPKDQDSHNALASVRPGMFEAYGVGSGNSSRDIDNILEINALNTNLGGRKFGFSSGVP
ncbi:MAG: twin-arginine translocation signal domain-containing protein, partial [Hellea sp.]